MMIALYILCALTVVFIAYCVGYADGAGPPPKGKKWPQDSEFDDMPYFQTKNWPPSSYPEPRKWPQGKE